jgi:hypothetical protein
MNALYLLNEEEYKKTLKKYDLKFKKEILTSNFNILITKILGQFKLIIGSYKKEYIIYIENVETKLKLLKIVDNNYLFNKIYALILECQCLFEEDINKYLENKANLFTTVYNILLSVINNKNLLEKCKRFIKDYKNYIDENLYNFLIKFIKMDVLNRIILLVNFIKKKLLDSIVVNNNEDKLINYMKKMNAVVIFKINKLLIYIIDNIIESNNLEKDLKVLRDIDVINIKIFLTFIIIVAKTINKEILKIINRSIKKTKNVAVVQNKGKKYLLNENLYNLEEEEEEDTNDTNDANDTNESDIEIEKKDYMDSDILEIIKYRKKELNIDISVLKNMMRYDTLIEINNRININEDNILNILEEPKVRDILELIKQICEYEFNIKRENIDKYLKYLCEIYLNKENILNDLNINKKVYNDIFNNLKYLFKISNWYFKIELES